MNKHNSLILSYLNDIFDDLNIISSKQQNECIIYKVETVNDTNYQ